VLLDEWKQDNLEKQFTSSPATHIWSPIPAATVEKMVARKL